MAIALDERGVLVPDFTNVVTRNLASTAKIVCNRGGAGSSKSYSLAQIAVCQLLNPQARGIKILVVRKTLPSLRLSVLLTVKSIIEAWNVGPLIAEEKTMLNFTHRGSLLHFGSLDDPEKIKSTDWNIIWMEEATDFTYEDFLILLTRLRAPEKAGRRNQMVMSFNPIDENHWIKSRVIEGRSDVEEIISTYKDNPYNNADYICTLESLLEQDENYHRIYACGEWGRLENLIYRNWEITNTIPESRDVIYGLDFGFNNPSGMVKITLHDGIPYCQEMIYQTGLTNSDLIARMQEIIPVGRARQAPIYADAAEPDRIEEIGRAGFNVHPADKEVVVGIDFVKRHRLRIHRDSANLLHEIRGYSYKRDRNGVVLEEPIKYRDHLVDPIRYGLYTHLGKKPAFTPEFRAGGTGGSGGKMRGFIG